jgi:hypothetical protein
MKITEKAVWKILDEYGIPKSTHGPSVMELERCVIIIGKEWREFCKIALQEKNISCSFTENQVIIPK